RHPWRNVVTKVIGMPAGVEPTRYEVQLNPGDVLLLATDGLFKMLADEEVSRILTGAANAESAAAALVDAANAAGGIDNIGVALYRA
ncbi:MAG TPA: SpoIIE family protein phosphatase, partial [Tepidiformaceae bacterium]|nr:SpoIIE family protein phosphatase [Tepidiformaceae bacterium]